MIKDIEIKKKLSSKWFEYLQLEICKQFELLEKVKSGKRNKVFKKKFWKKKGKNEGGGVFYILENGNIFEKVGVNKSTVSGQFKKQFRNKIMGADRDGKYWASGISVVAHMKNPKIPAVHFNTRFIVTSKSWFGGGIDVTQSFKDNKEKNKLHKKLFKICKMNNKNYRKYKKTCDKYFFLPHRDEIRGIGGLFFDYEKNNWENNFNFIRNVGIGFLDITKEIISKKINIRWSSKDKEQQLLKRGRYVEFNLLYDRGTKFGLNSGGNIEAIFMSLPPNAKWK